MSAFRESFAVGGDTGLALEDHPSSRFGNARALLLRPNDVMEQPEWLAPVRHHMLIIDEPQSIQREALNRLQQASNPTLTEDATFRELLVLSATPRLGDPFWRDLIFDLVEPERMRLARDAGQEPAEWLLAREQEAAKRLVGMTSDEIALEGEIAFGTHSRTRRMSRQTRSNWGQYFPRRQNQVHRFHPLASECGRLELIDYLLDAKAQLSASTLEGSAWSTSRSLLRSRRSTREAIDRMERPPEFANRVRQEATLDFGDSRLDALTDILANIFAHDEQQTSPVGRPRKPEKVVIVAGDAGTIDMLATVLPRYFPELADGGISSLKRMSSTSESSFEDIREMHEILKPFTEGAARILLLGDWVQAGLNLQHTARNMIFYSLPWDPQAIDQLIGRIDRLSHSSIVAAHSGGGGAGTIRIWQLVMRHSLEEKIYDALDVLGVFTRPLPQLSEDSWITINRLIVEVVTGKGVHFDNALSQLRDIKENWLDRGFESALDYFDPLTIPRIMSQAEQVGEIAGRFAIEGEEGKSPAEKIELANSDWLRAVNKVGGYSVFNRPDQADPLKRFNTLWYSSRTTAPPFYLPDMGQSDASADGMYFLVKRRDMSVPPARTVLVNAGESTPRPLQFYDHGATVHDQLCQGWLNFGVPRFSAASQREIVVRVGTGHPALEFNGRPILLSAISRQISPQGKEDVPAELEEALARFSENAAETYLAQHQEGLDADRRWLAQHLPTQVAIKASILSDGVWEGLGADQVSVLLRCSPTRDYRGKVSSRLQNRGIKTTLQSDEHRKSIQTEFDRELKPRVAPMLAEWKLRRRLIGAEAEDHATIYENRSEARAQVTSTEMAAARRGLVEADLRRASLMRIRNEARTKATEQVLRSLSTHLRQTETHACLRFVEEI